MDATTPEARVPLQIGRYKDLQVLGRGGMGAVYRAYDPELDRPVAIKVMLHSTPDFIARFRREAQSIARLTHGNVVQVFDFGVDEDDNPYFVMELVEGTPLDALLRERGRLPPADAIEIARQAALGLAAAHRAGIIHRDIKPSNLIVDARGGVKLVDFGIARASSGAQLTTAASLMGTPGYMAPEQAQGKPVDHRADLYALGLTLFEMLAGQAPFYAEDPIALVVMNMQEPLPDLRQRGLDLPEALVALVEQMAQKAPDARPQSADAVVRALDGMAALVPTSPRSRPVVADASMSSIPPTHIRAADAVGPRRRGLGLALGVALLIGGVGVTLVVTLVPTGGHPDKPKGVQVEAAVKAPEPAQPKTTPPVTPPVHAEVGDHPGATLTPKTEDLARRPEDRSGPLRVAVLRFQNVGKDPELESLSEGIGETVLNELVAVERVKIFERNDIKADIEELDRAKDTHFDKASVPMSGNLQGVDLVVQGAFFRLGGALRVTARFVRVSTAEVVDTLRVDGRVHDNTKLQDRLAAELKTRLVRIVDKERPLAAKGTDK